MSDRGIPTSFRHMHGFGSHTYSFLNANNERFWVKFHFRTQQGIKNLTDAEAADTIAHDRESNQRDLYENIEAGNFPKWTLFVQIMPETDAATYHLNPFDLTKVWPKGDYPLIEVGVMELNRNPDNYFAEVEQAAFAPTSIVPGISFSPDKMLQGRLFSYGDAQRYRLGVNHAQIPVNAPRVMPITATARCGSMATMARVCITNPICSASGRNSPIFPNRPWRLTARRITGTSGWMRITTRSPATCSG